MQHGRTTGDLLKGQLTATPPAKSEYRRAVQKLEELVLDGLRHGFFEFTVSCETINGKKRRFVIKAGVSHQFTIPIEELDACA